MADPQIDSHETEVLIVGAGPVGLALAVELGQRGVRCLCVDQHEGSARQPRAKTTNVRSMEHMRRWGLADRLRALAPLPADYPSDIVFATRLGGHTLARFENAFYCARERDERFSEPAQWIPQYRVEEVLRDCARTLPSVTLRLGCRFTEATQDDDGVSAVLQDGSTEAALHVRAQYLVGADGGRSTVRELLGIGMTGQAAFSHNVNIVFRSPGLERMHSQGRAIQYWIVNPELRALMGPMDHGDLWFFMALQMGDAIDAERIDPTALIRQAAGFDVPVETRVVDPWVAHGLIAERYGQGRMLLAGDACHLHPPMGGYGMNMGIGDAVHLGWKLAAVLQGWGGTGLLEHYATERRPVHERVIAEAVSNYSALPPDIDLRQIEADGLEGDRLRAAFGAHILETKVREFKTLGVVLGDRYTGSPLIVPDGSAPPADHVMDFRPSAHPGCRAPHAWLSDGRSLFDTFGAGLTLLDFSRDSDAPLDSAKAALAAGAETQGIPFKCVAPGEPHLCDLYEARFALIRPDQHVAWRGHELPVECASLLRNICGHL